MSPLPKHLIDCPPVQRQALPRRVYRLLTTETPEDSDFETFAEMRRGNEPGDPIKACRWHGVSLFGAIEDAQQHIDIFGDKPFIGFADLAPEHGTAEESPNNRFLSHMTWWPSDGLDRKGLFKCE